MLADHPRIVFARPPQRIRRKPKVMAQPKPVTAVMSNERKTAPDAAKAADAADRLWRELVMRATEGA